LFINYDETDLVPVPESIERVGVGVKTKQFPMDI